MTAGAHVAASSKWEKSNSLKNSKMKTASYEFWIEYVALHVQSRQAGFHAKMCSPVLMQVNGLPFKQREWTRTTIKELSLKVKEVEPWLNSSHVWLVGSAKQHMIK